MLLDNKMFLIKKQIKYWRYTTGYNIHDPETDKQIGVAREESQGLSKVLGVILKKAYAPKLINFYDLTDGSANGKLAFTVRISAFSSKVVVTDRVGNKVGRLDSKLFSGSFYFVYDDNEREIGQIKGHLRIKHYFMQSPHEQEMGVITRMWDGPGGEEVLKSPRYFVVALEDAVAHSPQTVSMLLLAAGIAMDYATAKTK